MSRYVLLLGSNQDRQSQIQRAVNLLDREFGILRLADAVLTPDYQSQDPDRIYLNQGVEIASPLSRSELKLRLREIETKLGRVREPKLASTDEKSRCVMDIDLALEWQQNTWRILDAKAMQFEYAQLALAPWRLG